MPSEVEHLTDVSERPRRIGDATAVGRSPPRLRRTAREVRQALDLDEQTAEYLETPHERPVFSDHGRYIHITTYAPREDQEGELHAVECVVGENWVITSHDESIPVLEEFAARVSGSGDTGTLDGPCFLAALLEWVLGAYTAAFERIEERLEEFDVQAMRGRGRRRRHRDADSDASRGGQPSPSPGGTPLRPRRLDAPRARAARQQQVL